MVVEEAKSTNNQIAARNHSLDDRLIRRWRKEESKLREMCDTKRFRMDGAGRKIHNSELEEALLGVQCEIQEEDDDHESKAENQLSESSQKDFDNSANCSTKDYQNINIKRELEEQQQIQHPNIKKEFDPGQVPFENHFNIEGVDPLEKAKKSKRAFSLEYKLLVVEEAKKTNNRHIARDHGLDESVIRRWRKDEIKIREAIERQKGLKSPRLRLDGAGRKVQNKGLEEALFAWVIAKQADHIGT